MKKQIIMNGFNIEFKDWRPKDQKLRESLCTLGNGYFATRGAAEELENTAVNYPGTYLAGGYNRAKTKIADREIENEAFVNFPNWLYLNFKIEGGEWLNLDEVKILEYTQTLKMQDGLLERRFKIVDGQGRKTSLRSLRMVSMKDKHIAAIKWFFTPENWSGKIVIKSALDGKVTNDNVERYRDLEITHIEPLYNKKIYSDSILLVVQTKQSKIKVAEAARTRVYYNDVVLDTKVKTEEEKDYISQEMHFEVTEGEHYELEKIVSFYTNKDLAITEPALEACKDIKRSGRFSELLERHKQSWERLWLRADIGVIGEKKIQELTRFHIFHILQSVSLNTIGLDVGVPSRGLHGEGYRGHIFWDELFIFPFLNLRFPEITRSLLMYRYYRLDEARFAAKKAGFKGAMFPWQSGSNGREESQVLHLNPDSGNWIADETHLQRHVNSAIVYNIWNYYQATLDRQFLSFFGAEIALDIACFWASKAFYNKEKDRYEIHGVVGPDEYHTSYPDSDQLGLNNNAYTNVLTAWVFQKVLDIVDVIGKSRKRELLKELEIDEEMIALWKDMSNKMYVPFLEDGIISQFEGYNSLKEFPWEEYEKKYENIHRLDRVLEKEGDTPNNYKASKQADVLMLFYLFSKDELNYIFEKLGYEFNEEMIYKNIDYYKDRTSHGSTLSRLVFSWILSKHDRKTSWNNFRSLLISDFEDIQGGTTPEGIHLGAMAGSLDLIQRSFAGIETGEEALWITPNMPKNIEKITMRIKYRNHWILIALNKQDLKVSFEEGWSNKVNIGVIDELYEFKNGEEKEFHLDEL